MLKSIEALWSWGTHGQPARDVRQISLTNQIALSAAAVTTPYLVFYLISDPRYYLPIISANLVFIGIYFSALPLNRAGRHRLAAAMTLAAVYAHLFVVTYFISTAAGVHLFYFALGAASGMLLAAGGGASLFLLMLLSAVLFMACHWLFPPGSASIEIPTNVLNVMYGVSAIGTIFVAGVLSFLFRRAIDRLDAALTRSNEELERLSSQDPLTGLANRRTLDEYLERELSRLRRSSQYVSVLMCDVDHFKQYNDHYGHQAGDACLRAVAGALSRVIRRSSDLVARYGGEEFVIVLPVTDLYGATKVAEEARALVHDLAILHDKSSVGATVSISVGVVCADPEDVQEPSELLSRADAALYEAKRAGRDRVAQWRAGIGHPNALSGAEAR